MNPVLRDCCSSLSQQLTALAVLMCAFYGAPVYAQMLYDGPGAGYFLPQGAPIAGPESACSTNHYHGPKPFPGGVPLPGPHCGWGRVLPFIGIGAINLNTPGGSLVGGNPGSTFVFDTGFDLLGAGYQDPNNGFFIFLDKKLDKGFARDLDETSARIPPFKISETDSPKPQDRVFFNYDFFAPVSGLGTSSTVPGLDKTFIDGQGSIGMRLPFVQIQGLQVLADGFRPAIDPDTSLESVPFLIVGRQATVTTFLDDDPDSARPFPAFVLIDILDSNPIALAIPIDAPPLREFGKPPVEDLDAKARAELQKEVQRMSPEDRQKALDNPLASPELKQAVLIENLRSIGSGVTATDAFRNPRDFRIDRLF